MPPGHNNMLLDEQLESLSVNPNERFPKRPNFGQVGSRVPLVANAFRAQVKLDVFYHYDVDIKGVEKKEREVYTQFLALGNEELKDVAFAFDGRKNIYSNKKISVNPLIREFDFTSGEKSIKVSIKLALVAFVNMSVLRDFLKGKLAYTPCECFQALDVIMRDCNSYEMTQVGRSLFSRVDPVTLPGGIEIWPGVFMSVRACGNALGINTDVNSTAFYKQGPLLDSVAELLGKDRNFKNLQLKPNEIKQCEKFFNHVRVKLIYGGFPRKYTIHGISKESCDSLYFNDDEGKKTSVSNYFKKKFKLDLKYPQLPCIQLGTKSMFVPMEVCDIVPGQRYKAKLNEIQTAGIIKLTCKKPVVRFDEIGKKDIRNARLDAFGIEIQKKFIECQGRILPPPTVFYHPTSKEKSICPRDGGWNMTKSKYNMSQSLLSWAVVNFSNYVKMDQLNRFIEAFVEAARQVGMTVTMANPPVFEGNPRNISIQKAAEKASQLILVILPETDVTRVYSEVKRLGDTVHGVITQCMMPKHVGKANNQYINNLLLKVNSKLGGVNLSLEKQLAFIVSKPTVVFGADVTHPPAGSCVPSIAAVVCSLDPKLSTYASAISVQGSKVETIENLSAIAKKLLISFYKSTKYKPQRILFYRDGVSEGQFAAVQDIELAAIKEACASLEVGYNPAITFVIVQKRHHYRFMNCFKDHSDRSGNVRAGTVIDTAVVHPNQFDFYLYSHGGIQGTSRPTHYHVVHDENNFSADDLQQLTYWMCFTFARCTRSVSIVPAVYYAHLVAYRGRMHTKLDESDNFSQLSDATELLNQVTRIFQPVSANLANKMYFI